MKDLTMFKFLTNKMRHLAERQKVITTNLANAASPNYQAKRLKSQSFSDLVSSKRSEVVGMNNTSAKHMAGKPSSTSAGNSIYKVKSSEKTINGNTVKPEEELMLLDKTGTEYHAAATVYKKTLKLCT